jgi:hypothetical protein
MVLFSYLFLLTLTSLHSHKIDIDYNSNKAYSNHEDASNYAIHDPYKCTILHFANFQTLVKKSFTIDEEFKEIVVNLESNKLHLLNKKFLFSKLRAPPSYNS